MITREERIERLHNTWNFYKSLGWRMHLLVDHFNFWLKRYGGKPIEINSNGN